MSFTEAALRSLCAFKLANENTMSSVPLTVHGAQLLKDELQRLKHVERPAVINAISEARAIGELIEIFDCFRSASSSPTI